MAVARWPIKVESVQAEQSGREQWPSDADMDALVEKVLGADDAHIPTGILLEMKVALGELLGEAAAAVLYHLSKEGMKAWCTGVSKEVGLPKKAALMRFLERVAARNNWGRIRFSSVDPPPAICEVTVEDCFECDSVSLSDGAVCHFMRGVVAGAASVLFGVEADAVERSCRAAGEACCRFEVKWRL